MTKNSAKKKSIALGIPEISEMPPIKRTHEIDYGALCKAQDMVRKSYDARRPATCLKRARRAIEISPYCADAYDLIGDMSDDIDVAISYYERAVEAGYYAITSDDHEEFKDDLWSLLDARPYMRAKESLAYALRRKGQLERAIALYQDLLELNPNDNQGNRYALLSCYIEAGEYKKAQSLLKDYEGDSFAAWHYGRLLVAYLSQESPDILADCVAKAKKANSHVIDYLLRRKSFDPDNIPAYHGLGDEAEAMHYIYDEIKNITKDESFISWLKNHERKTSDAILNRNKLNIQKLLQ